MATPRSPVLWAVLAGAALLLIAALALLLISRPGGGAATSAPTTVTCPSPAAAAVASPVEDSSPVVLWGVSPVRLYVDGQAAFSPPEEPKRFTVGVHTLRAEAPGEEAVETRFRVEPFTAGLIHAQLVPGLGISLVRLGAGCAVCAFAESPPAIDPEPARFPVPALFIRAATLLRRDQYTSAAEALAQIPPAQRRTVAFTRLASTMYADAAQPVAAR